MVGARSKRKNVTEGPKKKEIHLERHVGRRKLYHWKGLLQKERERTGGKKENGASCEKKKGPLSEGGKKLSQQRKTMSQPA